MNDIGIREQIKTLRKTLNLTQAEFGQKLGVSAGVIANIELDRARINPVLLQHMCDVFAVNKEWLETGQGEMFKDFNEDVKFEILCSEIAQSDDIMLKNAMRLYWSLSDKKKKAVCDFVKSLQPPEK